MPSDPIPPLVRLRATSKPFRTASGGRMAALDRNRPLHARRSLGLDVDAL